MADALPRRADRPHPRTPLSVLPHIDTARRAPLRKRKLAFVEIGQEDGEFEYEYECHERGCERPRHTSYIPYAPVYPSPPATSAKLKDTISLPPVAPDAPRARCCTGLSPPPTLRTHAHDRAPASGRERAPFSGLPTPVSPVRDTNLWADAYMRDACVQDDSPDGARACLGAGDGVRELDYDRDFPPLPRLPVTALRDHAHLRHPSRAPHALPALFGGDNAPVLFEPAPGPGWPSQIVPQRSRPLPRDSVELRADADEPLTPLSIAHDLPFATSPLTTSPLLEESPPCSPSTRSWSALPSTDGSAMDDVRKWDVEERWDAIKNMQGQGSDHGRRATDEGVDEDDDAMDVDDDASSEPGPFRNPFPDPLDEPPPCSPRTDALDLSFDTPDEPVSPRSNVPGFPLCVPTSPRRPASDLSPDVPASPWRSALNLLLPDPALDLPLHAPAPASLRGAALSLPSLDGSPPSSPSRRSTRGLPELDTDTPAPGAGPPSPRLLSLPGAETDDSLLAPASPAADAPPASSLGLFVPLALAPEPSTAPEPDLDFPPDARARVDGAELGGLLALRRRAWFAERNAKRAELDAADAVRTLAAGVRLGPPVPGALAECERERAPDAAGGVRRGIQVLEAKRAEARRERKAHKERGREAQALLRFKLGATVRERAGRGPDKGAGKGARSMDQLVARMVLKRREVARPLGGRRPGFERVRSPLAEWDWDGDEDWDENMGPGAEEATMVAGEVEMADDNDND
ncbi:hypothetical protein K488DRAFT_82879 [Vararia minispora EC-137]|uniref:Uncharacterized protein n=1 Tax=Vararia minispora EC-137 TaxID=1314806 RepID=A0ACB8QUS4_9AGAM|nr:hypothetical protein K488DRAFT_82879 [Vararia minispora EC-137]